jgi:hypothetical protein
VTHAPTLGYPDGMKTWPWAKSSARHPPCAVRLTAAKAMAALGTTGNIDRLRIAPTEALRAVSGGPRFDIAEGAMFAAPGAPLTGVERGDLRIIGGLAVGLVKLRADRAAKNAAQSRAGGQGGGDGGRGRAGRRRSARDLTAIHTTADQQGGHPPNSDGQRALHGEFPQSIIALIARGDGSRCARLLQSAAPLAS